MASGSLPLFCCRGFGPTPHFLERRLRGVLFKSDRVDVRSYHHVRRADGASDGMQSRTLHRYLSEGFMLIMVFMALERTVLDRLLVGKSILAKTRLHPVAQPDRHFVAAQILACHDAAELSLAAVADHCGKLPQTTKH